VTSETSRQVRVAAAQCTIGSDIDENLRTCLRVLDKAAGHKPELVVLPEFCNHLSWYDNAEHCYDVSLSLDSPFLAAIAEKAVALGAYVSIGVTLRRADNKVSGSALLYSPTGELLGIADKQVLIGHENDFLQLAQEAAPIIDTDIGRLAMYMCMDGVINETPHCLALRGAQVLCNSLNSFAPDEGNLHIPVRAAENKVFVVAANKVGPLVPEAMMADISAATNIPEIFLCGAGESQIVAPDGTVLAMAKTSEEEVISVLITPPAADNKLRPDGTDIFTARRPELYASLGENPASQSLTGFVGARDLQTAMIRWQAESIAEVCELVGSAQASGARLIALSPPAAFANLTESELTQWQQRGVELVDALSAILKGNVFVVVAQVGTHPDGFQHQVAAIGAKGVIATQGQVHFSRRFAWSKLADGFASVDLPFGRLCMLTSDDSIYPESFRLCAMATAEIAVVPMMPLEQWELHTGLVERAAENRLNLLAATSGFELGRGFAAGLLEDFTVFGEWKSRVFDGVLTRPPLTEMCDDSAITLATLHPYYAENKVVSRNTHLIDNRPWHLLQPMTSTD
jgi:predicted amidohydrolase